MPTAFSIISLDILPKFSLIGEDFLTQIFFYFDDLDITCNTVTNKKPVFALLSIYNAYPDVTKYTFYQQTWAALHSSNIHRGHSHIT